VPHLPGRRTWLSCVFGVYGGSLDCGEELLDDGPDAVFEALTSRARSAIELRQNSPFAGVLTTKERQAALNSFRTHWKTARTE